MEDFAAKVIAAHQAGLAERRQQQQLEQQAEEHKLNVQAHKLNLDAAKLQQAQVERQIQALSSGGPTGQATTTIQSPTVQPANIPTDVQPPQMAPGLPQTIQDLITRTRAPLPQMQPIPSGQDTSLNGSVPTGLPPAGPDIPVQLSDGRTITLPGTNMETEQARAMQQAIQGLKLKGLEPYTLAEGAVRHDPLTGTTTSGGTKAAKLEAKEGTFLGVPTNANFNPDTGEYSIGGRVLPPGAFKPKESTATEAHNTITTDQGIMQFNPKTGKYDIKAGNAPPKAEKDNSLAEANALERSYNARDAELNKLKDKVDTGLTGIGQAKDLLAQNNPGANSLAAPAIIKAVVGGMGSGIRITQAELNTINGGRGKIDNFKSWLTSWSSDEKAYQALLPDQKIWLNGVLDKMAEKFAAKQLLISGASQALIDAKDATTHKQVIKDLNDHLEAIDLGKAGGKQSGGTTDAIRARLGLPPKG